MFFSYLKDMKSWIFFYLCSIGLVDVVIWLDQGISVKFASVFYFNMLLILFFIVFLIWRYRMEMSFTKKITSLINSEIDDWQVALPEAIYVRDEKMKEMLLHAAKNYSHALADLKETNIHEGDYVAAWVHEVKTPLTAMKLIIDEHRGNPAFGKIELARIAILS